MPSEGANIGLRPTNEMPGIGAAARAIALFTVSVSPTTDPGCTASATPGKAASATCSGTARTTTSAAPSSVARPSATCVMSARLNRTPSGIGRS
jgi:hypothetical protein